MNYNQWPEDIPLPLDFLAGGNQPALDNNAPLHPLQGARIPQIQGPITPPDGIPMPVAPPVQPAPITPPDGIPMPVIPLPAVPPVSPSPIALQAGHVPQPPTGVQPFAVVVATNLSRFAEDSASVKQVSFKLRKGMLTAITGEYSDGSTALLRLLALEDTPSSGSLVIDNRETGSLNPKERNDYQQAYITYIRQSHVGLSDQSGHVLVAYWLHYFEDIKWSDAQALAQQALQNVGISYARSNIAFRDLLPYEQARVSIAKVCVRSRRNHTLYLFDDLFADLNTREALDFIALLTSITRRGKTIVALINRTDVLSRFDHVLAMKNEELIADNRHA